MGKIKRCSIQLRDNKELHRPGETVSGVMTLEIEGDLTVRTITIFCRGQSLTKWSTPFQSSYESDSISKEIYFNSYITLYTANPPVTLNANIYNYNFRFKLPNEGLPSSFESTLGATRYWLMVEVDKPFPSINDKFYKCFTLLAHLDVNEPAYRQTVYASAQKPVSKALGIGNAGTLSLTANLDRAGYCPGEKICINLEAKNQSTKDLGRVKASLVQRVDYTASSSTDLQVRTIRTMEGDKLEKERTAVWTDQLLLVDALPPSSKQLTCHIIKVSYHIKVEVEVPLGLNLDVHIPITICTAPLGTPIPSQPRHIGQNLYLTDKSRLIGYARCSVGIQNFGKSCTGFPLMNFKPLTVYVQKYNREQALAKLQTAAGGSMSLGATAAPVTKPPPLATLPTGTAASATKSPSGVAANTQPTSSSKEAEATLPVPHVIYSTPTDSPPSYEEACAQENSQAPVPQAPTEAKKGSVLMLHFPCVDTQLVADSFKRNMSNLLFHGGKIEAFVPEIQFLPSQKTAAVLIYFDSERTALGWLQNMTSSNRDLSSRLWALIAENRQTLDNSQELSAYKSLAVYIVKLKSEFKQTKIFSEEYKKCLVEALRPCKVRHNAKTILSAKVVFACGDWSSFPAKASELTFVVTRFPSLDHYKSYRDEFETDAGMKRFHELLLMAYSYVFYSAFDVGDISKFQGV